MKLDVLGFWGGTPEQGGATTGYLLHTSGGTLLIDCGSGVMSQLSKRFDFYRIKAMILTHLHADHIADVSVLQYGFNRALRNDLADEKLSVYAPSKPELVWEVLQSDESIFTEIEVGRVYDIAGVKVEFLPVNHTILCYAVKVTDNGKVFVFSGDTAYHEPLVAFASGADVFLCEATIQKGSIHTTGKGHMSASEAGRMAELAGVKSLILTHLPSDGDFNVMKEEAEGIYAGKVYMASDIKEFDI